MRSLLLIALFACSAPVWAQNPNSSDPASQPSPAKDSSAARPQSPRAPNLSPPRSDTINAESLGDEPGESSSKDTLIDLSPPTDDVKDHPQSSDVLMDADGAPVGAGVGEFHPWNPHKAAKDVEVGDFYFKKKNYRAAEDRYREALYYKDNDAIATFRLAVCLEKMDQLNNARMEYESYLKILPHGPQAEDARKAIDRLKGPAANATPSNANSSQ